MSDNNIIPYYLIISWQLLWVQLTLHQALLELELLQKCWGFHQKFHLRSVQWRRESLPLRLCQLPERVIFNFFALIINIFSEFETALSPNYEGISFQLKKWKQMYRMDNFTVVRLVAWPLNESEAGFDRVLIETSLLLLCKFLLISMRTASLA